CSVTPGAKGMGGRASWASTAVFLARRCARRCTCQIPSRTHRTAKITASATKAPILLLVVIPRRVPAKRAMRNVQLLRRCDDRNGECAGEHAPVAPHLNEDPVVAAARKGVWECHDGR